MDERHTIVYAIPVRNEFELKSQLDAIVSTDPDNIYDKVFVLAVNNSSSEFVVYVDKLASDFPVRVVVMHLGDMEGRPFSYAYFKAIETAVDLGDIVVEIDAGGAFPVKYAHEMITRMLANPHLDAVFSNRFFHSSRIHNIYNHATGRLLTSFIGTLLSNMFLGLGRFVPDMTSGLSAIRSAVAKKVLATVHSPDKFVSVAYGPGHFIQTEWRSLILWLTPNVEMYNIKMGEHKVRKPAKLGTGSVLQAFKSLFQLRARRKFIKGS